jgi:hypothetical protein
MEHPTAAMLEAGLDGILGSPSDHGRVQLIVRRPAENAREVLTEARLDRVGAWSATPGGSGRAT